MKRILLFCAAAALCVSFAACGIQNTSSESSGQTTASITNDNNTSVPGETFDNAADSTSDGKTTSDTVAAAIPTPGEKQVLYLWEEGNVLAETEYTINNGRYSDDPDFRPYLTYFPVPEGIEIKGAYTEGYVETCEVSNFDALISGQISIICPDPY